MTLSPRDRRALLILGVAAVLSLVIYFWPGAQSAAVVTAAPSSIPQAEQRLERLRRLVATLPGREQHRQSIEAQLKEREKGLIEAETAAQAQAQLLQVVRKLARNQAPPMEIGQVEMGLVQPLGTSYGEALVTVQMGGRIEQLVNLLADISAQPEMIATHELQVRAGDPKQKTVAIRLTVSGVLPRRLVPERKEGGVF